MVARLSLINLRTILACACSIVPEACPETIEGFNRYASFITGISPFQPFQSFNRFAPFKAFQLNAGSKRSSCFNRSITENKTIPVQNP
jgi:hypothetical protein